ncbi:MAG: DUF192 domain-containing protein [Candidatus Omnitrophica bacterium]|nr:DUF192 domain-containing protein [Candidatus Omnitrophota bacterium]
MGIVNKTKNTILAQDVSIANRLFKRMKGLLGRKEFKAGQAIILEPCNSIHTFFMRFPIDVLFVDKNNRVIKVKSSLKPFRLSPIYFNAAFAIELPSGMAEATSTSQGDILLIG